jgi:hypothetical protein
MTPPIMYLTDCADPNAQHRLCGRISALFGAAPTLFGVGGPAPDLEAALTLLDTLKSATELLGCQALPSIFLVNVAPRGDTSTWPNGTPFCYFWYEGHLVVSTLEGRTLSLVRRYLGVKTVKLVDIPTVMKAALDWTTLTEADVDKVANTQFRSLWFVPLLARWVWDGQDVPHDEHPLSEMELGPVVAYVDSFGNCKIVADPATVTFVEGQELAVRHGQEGQQAPFTESVRCDQRLADVPLGHPALVIGSSAGGFVELVVQRGNASKRFGLGVGDWVF